MSKRRGRYACLYGDFWRHPYWALLSPTAAGLWARSVSYCADGQTDGEFPWAMVAAWSAGLDCESAIDELLAGPRPRWKRKGAVGTVVNYSDNQTTREEWESRARSETAKRTERRTRAGLRLVSGEVSGADNGPDRQRTGGRT